MAHFRTAPYLILIAATVQLAALRPVAAAESCWAMGAGQFAEGITFCASGVLDPIANFTYGPKGLADGNASTAWCASTAGVQEAHWIELNIDRGSEFRRLLIQNGYRKSAETYYNNSRLRTIDISTDTGVGGRVTLPDQPNMVAVQLPAAGKFRVVRITIVDVYPGEKYGDICLDYLMPDFEYEEELLRAAQKPPSDSPPSGPSASPGESRASTTPKPSGPPDPFGDLGLPDAKALELSPK